MASSLHSHDISQEIPESERDITEWARKHKDIFQHDIGTLRLQTYFVVRACKSLSKEQVYIEKKSRKEQSKGLRECIVKYQECILVLQTACQKISEVVNNKNTEVHRFERRSTYDGRGKKRNKSSSFKDHFHQQQCEQCQRKDAEIMKLELESQRRMQDENESLRSLLQIESEAKEDALRRMQEVTKKLHGQLQIHIEANEAALRSQRIMNEEIEKLSSKMQTEMNAKKDALRSSTTSSKLRDNIPNITDLSDPNRPTKIAERLSELYDGHWKDAYDALEDYMPKRQIIETLLNILMKVYEECYKRSRYNFYERIQNCIESPFESWSRRSPTVIIPEQMKQQIKEFRKSRAAFVIEDIEKEITKRIEIDRNHIHLGAVQAYISQCVWIGWYCAVQDPPLVLSVSSSRQFDTSVFKDYKSRGRYIQFVVWPALYLHEGGPLMCKGVAQGCDNAPYTKSVITNN